MSPSEQAAPSRPKADTIPPTEGVRAFIESPYYRLSDVRMGMFFVDSAASAPA